MTDTINEPFADEGVVRGPMAWSLCSVTLALALVQTLILVAADQPLISGEFADDGFPVVTLAAVAAAVVGALIVTRHPRHRVGWLFLVGQVGTMAGLVCQSYGFVALTEGWGPRLLGQVAIWLSVLLGGIFALALMALLLLLVPDGRLLSARWRWPLWATVLGLALHDAAVLTVPPSRFDAEAQLDGGSGVLGVLALVGGFGVLVGLAGGALSLVLRMRRASGDQRAQLRWIGSAAFLLAASVPVGVALDLATDLPIWMVNQPLMLAYLLVPVTTGVAILRFRLYDIDLILNRSIVLAVLTVFVAVGYVAVVVVLGRVMESRGHGPLWTSAAATIVVALAFQPLRKRVERLADRAVYGERAQPYEALAALNDELRDGVVAAELLPRVAEATGRMVGARSVSVWIERPGEAPLTAEWATGPAGSSDALSFPVEEDEERLGGVTVGVTRGRGLAPAERRLVEDFAAQLGPAFRRFRLEQELAAQVALLGRVGERLTGSRLRLLTAQTAERLRFEAAINREVAPHIATMGPELRALERDARRHDTWPQHEVDDLIVRAQVALEALRTLTRGVFPAQLTRRGLVAALASHLDSTGSGRLLDGAGDLADRRYPPRVESVAYFCVVEALRALEGQVTVSLHESVDELVLTVRGTPSPTFEADTQHLEDRAEAAGGRLLRVRRAGEGSVTALLPVRSATSAQPDSSELVAVEG